MAQKIKFYALFFVFIFISLGCDQISGIIEGFKKPKQDLAVKTAPLEVSKNTPTSESKPFVSSQEKSEDKTQQEPSASNVLARVGKWTLTIEEFKERLNALREMVPDFDVNNLENKKTILEELVRQQLLVLQAEQTGLADKKDVVQAVEEFRRTIIVRETVAKITDSITATEEEAKAYYEKNKDQLIAPAEYHVREVVVDSQLKANEILVEILKGTDFSEMAKQHSIAESGKNGGDLGLIKETPFSEMASALLSLRVGDVSGVFKGPEGFYYIIKLEEKKGGEPVAYEEIKEDLLNEVVFEKKQQAILDYIDQLKQKTNIEINERLLMQ